MIWGGNDQWLREGGNRFKSILEEMWMEKNINKTKIMSGEHKKGENERYIWLRPFWQETSSVNGPQMVAVNSGASGYADKRL